VGQSEVAGFGGGAVGLRRYGRRAIWEEGPTCQLGAEWGKGGLRWGRFPTMEAETKQGTGAAHGPAGPGEEGGSPGRSGAERRPGLSRLISIGKKAKGF
jgi:hypothetical protein